MRLFAKDEFLQKLGQWIAFLRRKRGLGQDRLAEEAGLGRGTITKIEKGLVDPQASTLVKIAHAMDVPPPQLLKVAVQPKMAKD